MQTWGSIQPVFIRRVCMLAVGLSLMFVLMNFIFLFTVEDTFLEQDLAREKNAMEQAFRESGRWPKPTLPGMAHYLTTTDMPDGVGETLAQEPDRKEFYGEAGRHYHVTRLEQGGFLLYEVSAQLLIRPMRRGLLIVYGVLAVIATLIAGLVAYGLVRRMLRPLAALAAHVGRLSPDAAPEKFAQAYPANEIGRLAFELEHSLERIHAFAAREAQFARDVSHDLRTPLAVTSGALELLAEPGLDAQRQQDLITRMTKANHHMRHTVSALLSMVREPRPEDLKPQPLLMICENTILHHAHLLDGKDIDLIVDIAMEARVNAVDGVLEILLSNLLSNAFQYTEAGTIHIGYQAGILSVADTGPGVPPELQGHMFDAQARSIHSSGYGLGLSIVQRLSEHHAIDLSVEHQPTGTLIKLVFPGASEA